MALKNRKSHFQVLKWSFLKKKKKGLKDHIQLVKKGNTKAKEVQRVFSLEALSFILQQYKQFCYLPYYNFLP